MAIETIPDGIELSVKDDCYMLRIRKKAVGISKSGKMVFNANSHGWYELDNGLRLNVMMGIANPDYVKPKTKKAEKTEKPKTKMLEVPEEFWL